MNNSLSSSQEGWARAECAWNRWLVLEPVSLNTGQVALLTPNTVRSLLHHTRCDLLKQTTTQQTASRKAPQVLHQRWLPEKASVSHKLQKHTDMMHWLVGNRCTRLLIIYKSPVVCPHFTLTQILFFWKLIVLIIWLMRVYSSQKGGRVWEMMEINSVKCGWMQQLTSAKPKYWTTTQNLRLFPFYLSHQVQRNITWTKTSNINTILNSNTWHISNTDSPCCKQWKINQPETYRKHQTQHKMVTNWQDKIWVFLQCCPS